MGLSVWEIALIMAVALIVIGPKKLPDMAKSLGKGYREFRKAFNDIKDTVDINQPMDKAQEHKARWQEQMPAELKEASKSVDTAESNVTEQGRAKRSDVITGDDDAQNNQ